jgi:hypothetical protein
MTTALIQRGMGGLETCNTRPMVNTQHQRIYIKHSDFFLKEMLLFLKAIE